MDNIVVNVHHFRLKMKTKFSIHHGSYDYRDSIIVELQYNGISGYGETIAIDYYGQDLNTMLNAINEKKLFIEYLDVNQSPEKFYKQLQIIFGENPFIICAFDCAFWDLQARIKKVSIQTMLGLSRKNDVVSSITIGKNEEEQSVRNKLEESWPIIKWKFDKDRWQNKIGRFLEHNKKVGIDANGGLTLDQAKLLVDYLQEMEGLYLEQPFPRGQDELVGGINNEDIIILADESISSIEDVKRLIDIYDGFVLKLTKFGGITPVIEAAKYIKSEGKKILLGCMTESSVGISNMSELLPLADFADLDGAVLITNDPFQGAKLKTNGQMEIEPTRIGNGVILKK